MFRKTTKPKSANPHAKLKVGFLLLSTGLFLQILFLNLLAAMIGIETGFLEITMIITGLPELDIIFPFIIILFIPILGVTTNLWITVLSIVPWVIAGAITGYYFGPHNGNSILLSFPVFFGSIGIIAILGIFTLVSSLIPVYPSIQIFGLALGFVLLGFYGLTIIGIISVYFFVPSYLGYYIGKKYSPRLYPLIFYAQPNRIDPIAKYCKFLTHTGDCGVGSSKFIPGTCDNRFNQVTCPFYLHKTKPVHKKILPGGLFSEIK
jgi:hypothetical protein